MSGAERLGPGREFDLIRSFLGGATAGGPRVVVGPGDDAAVVRGEGIVLSTDLSVEEVHFRREWLEPEQIGYRAATAALSDLAAMAARPIGILVSLALAKADTERFGVRLMRGAREAAEAVGAALIGGDLTASPGPIVLDVVVVGEAPTPVLRSGGRAGDELWVTGTLGGAALAVQAMLSGRSAPATARERYLRPTARTR